MDLKIFVNLTNGIEFLADCKNLSNINFLRIQSTHCEQKQWDRIIAELDSNFLMCLALGYKCIVLDCGSRSKDGIPRAIWQGLELIKCLLYKRWLDKEYEPEGKPGTLEYFKGLKLSKRSMRKIDYFKTFIQKDYIDLHTVCRSSLYDGNKEMYREIISKCTL